jgi:hypothetical protein
MPKYCFLKKCRRIDYFIHFWQLSLFLLVEWEIYNLKSGVAAEKQESKNHPQAE